MPARGDQHLGQAPFEGPGLDLDAMFGLSPASLDAKGSHFESHADLSESVSLAREGGLTPVRSRVPISIVARDPWVREGLRGLALACDDWNLHSVFSSLMEMKTSRLPLSAVGLEPRVDEAAGRTTPDALEPVLVADLHDPQERVGESVQLLWPMGWNVLALVSTQQEGRAALGAGARGVLRRSSSPTAVRSSVDALARGLLVLDPTVSSPSLPVGTYANTADSLSGRELEVLQQMLEGRSNREIALALSISANTVKFHVNAVMTKLGASTRTEAVVQAMRQGIVHL